MMMCLDADVNITDKYFIERGTDTCYFFGEYVVMSALRIPETIMSVCILLLYNL